MASSFTSEKEEVVMDYPTQLVKDKSPRGAYEARQVKGGFYVRVDMPGVPQDGVKLVKYGKTRKVTFTGKAPKVWECDSSDRVYAGYIVLDRNPDKVDVELSVVNGSLKLFFPGVVKATLHSLPSNKTTAPQNVTPKEYPPGGARVLYGDIEGCCHDKFDHFQDDTDQESALPHINPYLIHGVEGVFEHKLLAGLLEQLVYVRVDMPGLGENSYNLLLKDSDDCLFFGGKGKKEYHLDEGGRIYLGNFEFHCTCCKIALVEKEMKDGVLRLLIQQKVNILDCLLPVLLNKYCNMASGASSDTFRRRLMQYAIE